MLNEIDTDQANESSTKKLKDISANTEQLMKTLKFIKSVFDSTDGYTSSEEEDKTYYETSKGLGSLINQLKGVNEKVNNYKAVAKFDDIDSFAEDIINQINTIESNLEKHCYVLQQISWKGKLSHRRDELKEAQQDLEDIISDGNKIYDDIVKIEQSASKNPEENAELIEKLTVHMDQVAENLNELENKKIEYESINVAIQEFADLVENRDNTDYKQIVKLLKKNKDIKESIFNCDKEVNGLDEQIDDIALLRDQHLSMVKKKYKPKKGDEVDEILANFINNSPSDVEIKRQGEGKYMIGEKKVTAKVVNGNLLIRVGGGYMTLEAYMESFGESKIKRSARRNKRENRSKGSMKKTRTLRYSGTKRVVGSADFMRTIS